MFTFFRSKKMIVLARECFCMASFLQSMDAAGIFDISETNPYFDPDFNFIKMQHNCPDLFLLAVFYERATPFHANIYYSEATRIAGSGDINAISSHFLLLNQRLKSALFRWLAIPEESRVKSLGKTLTPRNPGDSPLLAAETLNLQAKRLAATWIDWDRTF